MRRPIIMIAAALLALGSFESLLAQGRPPSEAAIAVSPRTPLAFGSIIRNGAGGSVSVNPDGTRSVQGVFATAGEWSAAIFDVKVDGAKEYTILLPSSATLVNERGDEMIVDAFKSLPAVQGRVRQPAGTDELACGATLHVAPRQNSGTYSGTYLVVVTILE